MHNTCESACLKRIFGVGHASLDQLCPVVDAHESTLAPVVTKNGRTNFSAAIKFTPANGTVSVHVDGGQKVRHQDMSSIARASQASTGVLARAWHCMCCKPLYAVPQLAMCNVNMACDGRQLVLTDDTSFTKHKPRLLVPPFQGRRSQMRTGKKRPGSSLLASEEMHQVVDIDSHANTDSIVMDAGETDSASAGGTADLNESTGCLLRRQRPGTRRIWPCSETRHCACEKKTFDRLLGH